MLTSLLAAAAVLSSSDQAGRPQPAKVMVLGTWHFDNPGLDIANLKAEDVLTSARQAQLEAISAALATFRPTKIMVERVAKESDLLDHHYGAFKPGDLLRNRDERVQIGYRLAARLGLKEVFAIDEQPGKDEPDYFPIGKVAAFAKSHNQGGVLDAMFAKVQEEIKRLEAKQATQTLAELLTEVNDPNGFHGRIDGYYEFLQFGDSQEQPGADLNAMWYLRNAKIFGKLANVAKPGDRVVVIFGSGHGYWLRHFASNVPGFQNVDPRTYLRRVRR